MTSGAVPSATGDLLRAFARRGWLFGLALVPAALLLLQPPEPATHVGTLTVSIRPADGTQVRELRLFDAWARRHVDTFAHLATTNTVLAPVADASEAETSPEDLRRQITVVQPENREVVSIEFTSKDHQETLATTQEIGTVLAARIEALSPRDDLGGTLVRAEPLGVSVSRVEPERSVLPAAALAGLGILITAAWVMWRFATDDVLRSHEDLANITSAPVIATFHSDAAVQSGAHLLRLHLTADRAGAGLARLVGTTASAAEAFDVREYLVSTWSATDATPQPHIEVIHPARIPAVPDAVVVAAVNRVTATRLVDVLCTIEEHGGTVAGVVAHVPRRWWDRLRKGPLL